MAEAVKHSLSFLLSEHDELDEFFNKHQRALLMRDIDGAVAMLATFENALSRHIAYEDEVLLPLFAAKEAETEGATLPIFHAEHAKLRQMCAKLAQEALNLYDSCDILGSILNLLDEEALFKGLFAHHAQRETNLLFPRLDACTTELERVKAMEMHAGRADYVA
jgi:regulator of cell morphogenesis and NO signaling